MSHLARLLRTTWGALLVIGAAILVGSAAEMWRDELAGTESVSEVDERVNKLERDHRADIRRLENEHRVFKDSVGTFSDRDIWIVCSMVPPNQPNVLAALRVQCEYDDPSTQRTIRGVPLLNDGEDAR